LLLRTAGCDVHTNDSLVPNLRAGRGKSAVLGRR